LGCGIEGLRGVWRVYGVWRMAYGEACLPCLRFAQRVLKPVLVESLNRFIHPNMPNL